MRAARPLLVKGELKTFATTASVGAFVANPGLSDYQISKLAVLRLTQFFSVENAENGIIAFSIHPGNIWTDMIGGEIPDPLKAVFTETPELCADSLVWFTKERREWLNGRYINCTWDLPELEAREQEIVDGDLLKVTLALPQPV
jgi:NAD(P)-dependent dehydrogenase (short-subunit alcohol dehydrogenase family)